MPCAGAGSGAANHWLCYDMHARDFDILGYKYSLLSTVGCDLRVTLWSFSVMFWPFVVILCSFWELILGEIYDSTAGQNLVMTMIPARDVEEFKLLPGKCTSKPPVSCD